MKEETFCTIFFEDSEHNLMPQDFPTYKEAKEYGEEIKQMYGVKYSIESPF